MYRYFNPNHKCYTWCGGNPIKQERLDYFISTSSLTCLVSNIDIQAGYKSDHSVILMSLLINNIKRGRGIWKLNTNLLKD